jgi:hypothetical protein
VVVLCSTVHVFACLFVCFLGATNATTLAAAV